MTHKELSELSDQELLDLSKQSKTNGIYTAFAIGIMVGIIIYSIVVNSIGFFTLIPLYFAYKMMTKPDHGKTLKEILKERNLE